MMEELLSKDTSAQTPHLSCPSPGVYFLQHASADSATIGVSIMIGIVGRPGRASPNRSSLLDSLGAEDLVSGNGCLRDRSLTTGLSSWSAR